MLEVVAAIIVDQNGRILLAQRPPGKSFAGLWEFPGGKVEPGEKLEMALQRELKEELSLEVRVGKKLGLYKHRYDWGEIALHVFVVHPLSAPQVTQDVEKFEWRELSQIDPEKLVEADRPALADYVSFQKARP